MAAFAFVNPFHSVHHAREWQAQEPDFRTRAFWSAKVENATFIDRAQGLIFDYMVEVRDDVTTPNGNRTTALQVGGREHFVELMRDFMIAEGMAKESEFKTDPRWALFHNDPEIGGFGVPWGPYGFNSGVTQEDVPREKAAKLGLDVDSVAPAGGSALDGLRTSAKGMDPALKAKLLDELRAGPSADDAMETAREAGRTAAAGARREMLHRGLTDAVGRGDAARAEKYRAAIAGLTTSAVLQVMEDGEKIVLETPGFQRSLSLLTHDETNPDTNSRGVEEDSLESAIAFIGGNARTTGEESFELRQAFAIVQRKAIVEWAQANGLMRSTGLWEGKAVTGASEHDVWQEGREFWKVTRPDHFGWTVLPGDDGRPESAYATPLEYLERWKNANLYLGDDARIRGVVLTEHGVQVVISHPTGSVGVGTALGCTQWIPVMVREEPSFLVSLFDGLNTHVLMVRFLPGHVI